MRAGHDASWLSYCKPFKPVSRDTISRWVKNVLEKAGINTKIFGAHSTRAAATSAAKSANKSINTIMDAAGWSSESTFESFMTNPFRQLLTLVIKFFHYMDVQSNKCFLLLLSVRVHIALKSHVTY